MPDISILPWSMPDISILPWSMPDISILLWSMPDISMLPWSMPDIVMSFLTVDGSAALANDDANNTNDDTPANRKPTLCIFISSLTYQPKICLNDRHFSKHTGFHVIEQMTMPCPSTSFSCDIKANFLCRLHHNSMLAHLKLAVRHAQIAPHPM